MLLDLFSKKEEIPYKELVKNGALILDVRSKEEFEAGHIKGAVNIPLDVLPISLAKIGGKEDKIITCCFSGGRSHQASHALKVLGYRYVYDGGGWQSLQKKLL